MSFFSHDDGYDDGVPSLTKTKAKKRSRTAVADCDEHASPARRYHRNQENDHEAENIQSIANVDSLTFRPRLTVHLYIFAAPTDTSIGGKPA